MDGEAYFVGIVLDRLYGRVPQVTRVAGLQDEDGTERPIPIQLLPAVGDPFIDATPDEERPPL